MAKNINISELDFDSIKGSIKSYMKSDDTFKDYDFEGSGLDTLTSLLSYNTYYNSFYLNMISNEMFLDTARIRDNVVSKAKLLGYTPSSNTSALATIAATFEIVTPKDETALELTTAKIDKDFIFKISNDGVEYRFVPKVARLIDRSRVEILENNQYRHVYEVFDLELLEGDRVIETYVVDTSDVNQKFIVSNVNVDTTTMKVFVQDSSNSNFKQEFRLNTDTMSLTDLSKTYFLQESNEKYEVFFGDGVLGSSVESGNIVTIEYIVCNGDDGNNITGQMSIRNIPSDSLLRASSNNQVQNNLSIVGKTTNGSDKESIESIKFYAPRTFEGQNRAVTLRDYQTLIPKIYPQATSVNVWGGEDNIPPVYGRVFLSVKPNSGFFLSESEKENLKSTLQKNYSVMGLSPEIVDPDFIKLKITTQVKYDDEATLLSSSDLKESVRNSIVNYNLSFLNDFNSYFRYSQFLAKIDMTDESITNNLTTIVMINEKDVIANTSSEYVFSFSNAISPNTIYSNAFNISGLDGDYFIDDNGLGSIRYYKINQFGTRIYLSTKFGSVNYTTGTITLSDLNISGVLGSDVIGAACTPASNDIFPVRNQIIYVDLDELVITMLEDTDEFNENYEISTQRVVVTRSSTTTYNTSSASVTSAASTTGSITRVYGDSVTNPNTSTDSSGSSSSSSSGSSSSSSSSSSGSSSSSSSSSSGSSSSGSSSSSGGYGGY